MRGPCNVTKSRYVPPERRPYPAAEAARGYRCGPGSARSAVDRNRNVVVASCTLHRVGPVPDRGRAAGGRALRCGAREVTAHTSPVRGPHAASHPRWRREGLSAEAAAKRPPSVLFAAKVGDSGGGHEDRGRSIIMPPPPPLEGAVIDSQLFAPYNPATGRPCGYFTEKRNGMVRVSPGCSSTNHSKKPNRFFLRVAVGSS